MCDVKSTLIRIRKPLHQKIIHGPSRFGREKPPLHLFDIFAILNRRNNGRIGGRPSDAFFFELFDQQGFVIPRRRLGEVLLRGDAGDGLLVLFHEPQPLAFRECRQLALSTRPRLPASCFCFCAKSSLSMPSMYTIVWPGNFTTVPLERNRYWSSCPTGEDSTRVTSRIAGTICEAINRFQINLYSLY